MHALVGALRQRARLSEGAPRGLLDALDFAEAAIRNRGGGATRHVAVIGPTQTGKSTIVNALLGVAGTDHGPRAGVSPLAGYTVHAHGFARSADAMHGAWRDHALAGMRVVDSPPARDELDAAVLRTAGECTGVDEVLWDTPDFDSLASGAYAHAVHEIASLADVIIVALSKEKYSDLAAWRMIRLAATLDRPMILCINKLADEDAGAVLDALHKRLREQCPGRGDLPIIPLYYTPVDDLHAEKGPRGSAALRDAVRTAARIDPHARHRGVVQLVAARWDDWTAPLLAEFAAHDEWHAALDAAIDAALAAYRRHFLDHPQRFDTLRLAKLHLLTLVEVPMLGGVMARARAGVTFPLRWAFGKARDQFDRVRGRVAGSDRDPPALPAEEQILHEATSSLLTTLERHARGRAAESRTAPAFWGAAGDALLAVKDALLSAFSEEVRSLRRAFEPHIRDAGDRLCAELQRHPVILNALRTVRLGVDTTALIVAIKTGGLHLTDVVIAPATLAVTSFVVEGAMGVYLRDEERRLKNEQFEHVSSGLRRSATVVRLRNIADELPAAARPVVSRGQFDRATAALDQLQTGGDE